MADVGPVLFVGDSVTRYQYMTLIHFLASGKYQHPFDGRESLSDALRHRPTKLHNQYDMLWVHAKNQISEHSTGGSPGLNYQHNRSAHLERAHLALRLHIDPSRKAHLYYGYVGSGVFEMQEAIDWAMNQRQDWRYLILNVCAHYTKDYTEAISRDVIAVVEWARQRYGDAFDKAGTQLVWKSCTTPQEKVRDLLDVEERKIAQYATATGLRIYDTRSVAKAATDQHLVTTWSAKEVHYLQFMYEQWNDLLLNILCPAAHAGFKEYR
ncbi:hypothetical protein HYH02_010760 [Chlamydomonas schloesseri]|uniref:Uncharacterized protein n=1 Tax=Chlamydomonas schloesseri TaxID=2026947 RepID=A0A835T565_9CHLO|nr:hypothetical protein HYH02_010760 [Chlamydomonas schloesseri]|eukprot:KAG2438968.1 hypothetical protein HYH02_010760 [Chlamydomonas schloesseri]